MTYNSTLNGPSEFKLVLLKGQVTYIFKQVTLIIKEFGTELFGTELGDTQIARKMLTLDLVVGP